VLTNYETAPTERGGYSKRALHFNDDSVSRPNSIIKPVFWHTIF